MPDSLLPRPWTLLPDLGLAQPGWEQLTLRGRDRAAFLHNFCTNDIKGLAPGRGCEAFLTNIKGRILGHIAVFAGNDELAIVAAPGSIDGLRAHLDRYLITEDVEFSLPPQPAPMRYVFGNGAAAALGTAAGMDLSGLENCASAACEIAGRGLSLRRFDVLAAPGFEVRLANACSDPDADLAAVVATLPGVVEASDADFDAWRIDAGTPRYGVDIDDGCLAQEAARTARAISFTKGCYLGQEPIARVDALGHVNRLLRLIVFEGSATPAAGDVLQDVGSGAELGRLTSVGRTTGSAAVGLALVRTSAGPGAELRAVSADGPVSGRIVAIE
ncbi:MAG: hypothetical protein KF774_13330 [Planctomyces sp.]|nr:hypothetical protein [Planctomyces sp.]